MVVAATGKTEGRRGEVVARLRLHRRRGCGCWQGLGAKAVAGGLAGRDTAIGHLAR